jgi:hypothetical protein
VVWDQEAAEGLELGVHPVAAGRESALETGRAWEARGSGQELQAPACWDHPCPGYARSCVERNDADFTERMPTANLTRGEGGGRPAVRTPPVRLTRRGGIGGCPPDRCVKRASGSSSVEAISRLTHKVISRPGLNAQRLAGSSSSSRPSGSRQRVRTRQPQKPTRRSSQTSNTRAPQSDRSVPAQRSHETGSRTR